MVTSPLEMLLRMAVAALLGSLIGFERERARRHAGLRTHLIVALASATFMLVSTQFVYFQHYVAEDLVHVDPSRIASCVVTGIGFLGAGAILRTGLAVQGLTTAASLWLVCAVGLAAGAGMYIMAAAATGASLFALLALRRFEQKDLNSIHRKLSFTFDEGALSRESLVARLVARGVSVASFDLDRSLPERRQELVLNVRFPDASALDAALRELESLPELTRLRVIDPEMP